MGIPHFVRNDRQLASIGRGWAAASPPPTPSTSFSHLKTWSLRGIIPEKNGKSKCYDNGGIPPCGRNDWSVLSRRGREGQAAKPPDPLSPYPHSDQSFRRSPEALRLPGGRQAFGTTEESPFTTFSAFFKNVSLVAKRGIIFN